MSETIEKRLSDLGVTLPVAAAPAANYVPYCRTDNLLFTAGQLPLKDGKLQASGLLGRDVDTAGGKDAGDGHAVALEPAPGQRDAEGAPMAEALSQDEDAALPVRRSPPGGTAGCSSKTR